VFVDPDGGQTVVDWKTGLPPTGGSDGSDAVQLACYRLAVSDLTGVPLEKVRAAFHFVLPDVTVAPVDLLDAAGLADLVRSRTALADGAPGPGADASHEPTHEVAR
jgi:DNA helicase-2/ATP-dependent DNA helicase PcrA